MSLEKLVQRYYRGNLTLFGDAQKQYESLGNVEEKESRSIIADDLESSNGCENDFWVLDNVNPLKNVMVFAEITHYKRCPLADMEEEERNNTIQFLIDNLDKFDVKPVGYEVKNDSLVIGWYLNNAIDTFTFSINIEALIH